MSTEPRRVDVASFEMNECKKSLPAGTALPTHRDREDYDGFECVAWMFERERQVIDLINRREGCGWGGSDAERQTHWTPLVTQSTNQQLDYRIEWNFASASACGDCLHDFSIELEDVFFSGELELVLSSRSCNAADCRWTRDSVTLPLHENRDGITCRHLDWRHAAMSGTPDPTLHMPARDGACDADLVPVRVEEIETNVCVATCSEGKACPLPEIQSCIDGTCQLTAPWPR